MQGDQDLDLTPFLRRPPTMWQAIRPCLIVLYVELWTWLNFVDFGHMLMVFVDFAWCLSTYVGYCEWMWHLWTYMWYILPICHVIIISCDFVAYCDWICTETNKKKFCGHILPSVALGKTEILSVLPSVALGKTANRTKLVLILWILPSVPFFTECRVPTRKYLTTFYRVGTLGKHYSWSLFAELF